MTSRQPHAATLLKAGFALPLALALIWCAANPAPAKTARQRDVEVRDAVDLLDKGLKYETVENYELAIDALNESRAKMSSPMTLYHLGLCHTQLGQLREARDCFKLAIEDAPDYLDAKRELRRVEALLAGREPGAIPNPPDTGADIATTAVAEAGPPPKRELTPEELRTVLFPPGEILTPTAGLPATDEARIIVDTYAWHFSQGQLAYSRNLRQRAAAEFVEALRLEPKRLECRLLLAQCLSELGRDKLAASQYEIARENSPDEPEAFYQSGNFYMKALKDNDRAAALFNQTIELDPGFIKAYINLGNAYLYLQQKEKARDAYLAGLKADPNYPRLHLNLGVLYDKYYQDLPKARAEYEKYIQLNGPDKEQVQRWLNKLEQKPPDNK